MISYKEIETDVLIIGSEAAGARAAIELADNDLKVLLVTKSIIGKSGVTLKATFSVSGAFGFADPKDNYTEHLRDMVVAGRNLNNQILAEIVAKEGPERLDELGKWGVKWDKATDGRYRQVKMYGHSYPRSLSVGFKVGLEWMRIMKKEIRKRPNIRLMNDIFVTNYFVSDKGQINGCFAVDLRKGETIVIKAKSVIDATGGGMYLYKLNSATPESTGDGCAMGYRIGAELIDMEFVQFYPIQLYSPNFLRQDQGITAFARTFLRARLYNSMGERFMERYDPENMELADRDVLSKAIFKEIKEGRGTPNGGVWLDASYLADKIIETQINKIFPNWTIRGIDMRKYGIDLRKDPLEVGPACHFFCGGLRVNKEWATNVPGLFAIGEAAGGIHGANRLPGDALVETQVSAERAAKSCVRYVHGSSFTEISKNQINSEENRVLNIFQNSHKNEVRPIELIRNLQDLMWKNVGIIRDENGLKEALKKLEKIKLEEFPKISLNNNRKIFNREWMEYLELSNMIDNAEMITKAALCRTESRGTHYREDYPNSSKKELKNIIIKFKDDKMTFEKIPVIENKIAILEEK